jgi:hypothetical protein
VKYEITNLDTGEVQINNEPTWIVTTDNRPSQTTTVRLQMRTVTDAPIRVGRQMETEEQREFWREVARSAREVDQWPAWLRGVKP